MKRFSFLYAFIFLVIAAGVISCGGNNIDAFLDDYEKIADKYVVLAEKAKSGDQAALTELSTLMTDAQKLQEKYKDVDEKDMTPAQKERFDKITKKFSEN